MILEKIDQETQIYNQDKVNNMEFDHVKEILKVINLYTIKKQDEKKAENPYLKLEMLLTDLPPNLIHEFE